MKAVVVREFGPAEVMKLEEVPNPSPGPGQMLVRAKAIGVNPVEVYIRSGTYARKPNLPYTPGTDVAGGGVGVAATQLARAHGLRVIGTAGTDKGMALVRAQGAHDVLNHKDAD